MLLQLQNEYTIFIECNSYKIKFNLLNHTIQWFFNSWVGKIHWRRNRLPTPVFLGFPCGLAGKESACNVWDLGSIPGLGKSPGEGKVYPLQYSSHLKGSHKTEWLHFHFSLSCIGEGSSNPLQCSCLENPRDRGAWWAAVSGVAQSWTRLKRLSSSSSSLSLLQGIFPTQGSNPGLPHCRQILYQLSHKGSPRILEWVTYSFSSGSFQPRNWKTTELYGLKG